MRTKLCALLVIVVGALAAVAAPAAAKGPSGGTIEGSGLAGPIRIDAGEGTPRGDALIQETGFFPAAFAESPDPMLDAAPKGDRGPRLTITWTVPGPGATAEIVQVVYPYAEGGPLTYTAPGQVFFTSEHTRGGWYRAPARLVASLQSLGVPSRAALMSASHGGRDVPWAVIGASLAAMVLLGGGLARFARRREVAPAAG